MCLPTGSQNKLVGLQDLSCWHLSLGVTAYEQQEAKYFTEGTELSAKDNLNSSRTRTVSRC